MKIEVNDVEYHVDITGEGFPLVLLHGFTGDVTTWSECLEILGKSAKIIAVDLIGHGKTSSPDDLAHYQMDRVVKDLAELLAKLDVEEADLVGYSMGGRAALALALEFPERVRKLVLESASPGLMTEEERLSRRNQDEHLALLIEEKGIGWFTDYWGNIPLFASQKKLSTSKQERIKDQRNQNSIKGLTQSLRGMGTGAQNSYWPHLETYGGDVLLLTGECDQKFVEIANLMQKMLKNSIHVTIAECGHAIHVEKPEKFGTIVSEFLSK